MSRGTHVDNSKSKQFNWPLMLAVSWLALLVVLAVSENFLGLRDPESLGIRTREVTRFEPPGSNAFFGGDSQGRDIFARVIAGIAPALSLGSITTLLAGFLGVTVGITAGFFRSKVDLITMLIIDVLLAFPALILIIAARAAFGNSVYVICTLFVITALPTYARLARTSAIALLQEEHIAAAISLGSTRFQVIRNEFFPAVTAALAPFFVIGFATVIIAEGSLSFVGLSIDSITWGQLIAQGSTEISRHWHLALLPGAVMFITILALNVIAQDLVKRQNRQPVIFTTEIITTPATEPALRSDISEPVVEVDVSSVDIEDDQMNKVRVLSGIDLDIEAGSIVGVIGESGSGKSMLLRSILTLFPVKRTHISGSVKVAGIEILNVDQKERRRILGTEIGVIAQSSTRTLHPTRTIKSQFIETILAHNHIDKETAYQRCLEVLERVGLTNVVAIANGYAHQLSGGMYQRVTVALALVNSPAILLADEPTAALDPIATQSLLELLQRLTKEDNLAVLMVSHNLETLSAIADSIVVIKDGRIVESGSTSEILNNAESSYTRELTSTYRKNTKC